MAESYTNVILQAVSTHIKVLGRPSTVQDRFIYQWRTFEIARTAVQQDSHGHDIILIDSLCVGKYVQNTHHQRGDPGSMNLVENQVRASSGFLSVHNALRKEALRVRQFSFDRLKGLLTQIE